MSATTTDITSTLLSDSQLILSCVVADDKTTRTNHTSSALQLSPEKAYRTLMNRYVKQIYNYLLKTYRDSTLAEEVTQDTFIKAYTNLKSFDTDRAFKPWLFRIASNTAVSYLRKHSNVVSLDAIEETTGQILDGLHTPPETDTLPSTFPDVDSTVMTALLDTLKPHYREILILRYIEDLSYDNIASTMDKPLNTIRTWLRRAKDQLAKAYTDHTNREPTS